MAEYASRILANGSMPNSTIDMGNGVVILPILGIIYLYGGYYILNMRYFYPACEHLIGLIDEKYTPFFFCTVNSIVYLCIMLYSTTVANDNLGFSTIIGSDAFNVFLCMALIQFRAKGRVDIDAWIFIKDTVLYLGLLGVTVAFLTVGEFYYWMGITWFAYWVIYAGALQMKNERLRDKLAAMVGLIDEDDVFSSAENYLMKKRRYSITDLTAAELFNPEDQELKTKMKRMEAGLRIQIRDKTKQRIYTNFSKLVVQVMFAMKKKIEAEKSERTKTYREKVESVQPKSPKKQRTRKSDDGDQSPDKLDTKKFDKPEEEDDNLLEDKVRSIPMSPNNDDVAPLHGTRGNNDDVLSRGNTRRGELEDRDPNFDDNPDMLSNPDFDEVHADNKEDTLAVPQGAVNKLAYFVFFPFRFIFFVTLFYFKQQVSIGRATLSIIIALVLQAGLAYLIIWWTEIIMDQLTIPPETAGLSFTSIGFSISWAVYNLRLQAHQKDANFLTSFEMIGIYKIGFAGSLGFLFNFAAMNTESYEIITRGFQITVFIFIGMFGALMIVIGFLRAKIPRKMYIPFGVFYVVFLIVSITLTVVYKKTF